MFKPGIYLGLVLIVVGVALWVSSPIALVVGGVLIGVLDVYL